MVALPVTTKMSSILKAIRSTSKNGSCIRHQSIVSSPLPKSLPQDVIPVFRKACNYTDRVALRDSLGTYTYGNLFLGAKELCNDITVQVGRKNSERILYLCPNDANYVLTQWAIWMSGQIAVPLSILHPQNLLEYYCNDSNAKLLICTPEYQDVMHRVARNCNKELLVLDDKMRHNATALNPSKKIDIEAGLSKDFYNRSNAMILYTSGTTGNPKGVVLSHKNIVSQVTTLIDAWKWTEADTLLHCLPLHHVHGIVNALLCPLYCGARVNMLPKFDKNNVWSHLLGVNEKAANRVSIFMAVPTIYARLIDEHKKLFAQDAKMCEYIKQTLQTKIRLMVCGSAPLPTPIYQRWQEISGHKLLERFGMTEIGMCLSNSYDGEREPGYVGLPLPGVTVRLSKALPDDKHETLIEVTNKDGNVVIDNQCLYTDPIGELHVKGDSVFKEYFNRPHATQKEFTSDGWFKTGDLARFDANKQLFKMLGRMSVDILKTGGYKVSALEIETNLLGHPKIAEASVIGVKDDTLGERVVAVIVLKKKEEMTFAEFQEWAGSKMPKYAVPREMKVLQLLDKNAMGKVNKRELVKSLYPSGI